MGKGNLRKFSLEHGWTKVFFFNWECLFVKREQDTKHETDLENSDERR